MNDLECPECHKSDFTYQGNYFTLFNNGIWFTCNNCGREIYISNGKIDETIL